MKISRIDIDPNGGFCGGVIRAVGKAENYLRGKQGEVLYSLGDIVHNESELKRLASLGLKSVSLEDIPSGAPVLIRAHGVSPAVYRQLRARTERIIDCTCPVVLGIQRKIAAAPSDVIIYGKKGHPEVSGLLGNAKGKAFVLENPKQAEELARSGEVCEDAEIFSQTTMSPQGYQEICRILIEFIPTLKVHHTICREVRQRFTMLGEFAREHDVLIFVSGRVSSNGRVLAGLAKNANPRTYVVADAGSIDSAWFKDGDSVGISGATSTPMRLLEEVRKRVENI